MDVTLQMLGKGKEGAEEEETEVQKRQMFFWHGKLQKLQSFTV